MKRTFLAAAAVFLTCSFGLGAEKRPGWVDRELEKIQESARFDFPAYTQWFYLRSAFAEHPEGEAIGKGASQHYQDLADAIAAEGMAVWGTAAVWTFPESSKAPRLPVNPNIVSTSRLVTSNCIPSFESVEYLKWSEIRNRMHATVAREHPELKVWWVGAEPDLNFYSCEKRALSRYEYVRFALDSLEGIRDTVKAENPSIQVGFHFLGLSSDPIRFRENGQTLVVQPIELLDDLATEASLRGYDFFSSFDLLAADLEPSLLLARQDEQSVPVTFGQTAMMSSGPAGHWEVKFLEEFNTSTSNLVANYDHWGDVRTDTDVTRRIPVEVASGKALLRLEQPGENFEWTLAGARTITKFEDSQHGVDVVPNQEWGFNCCEKNRWTAVSDWSGIPPGLDPPGAHGAVFIRVNDRTWTDGPNQTRFGTWIGGGAEVDTLCTSGSSGSQGDHLAALQFEGDDKTDSSVGVQWLCEFGIPENPFDSENQNEEYRVQIIEKVFFLAGFPVTFQLRWRAEVWSTTSSGSPIGWTSWISEATVLNEGIAIPSVVSSSEGDSKLMFAVGPGKDDGGIDVERTGTAYWVYE